MYRYMQIINNKIAKNLLCGVLLLVIGCASKKAKDYIKIVEVIPSKDTLLIKGSVTKFEVKVRYKLITAERGRISLVIQNQNGPLSGFPDTRTVNKGEGNLSLSRIVFITENSEEIDLFVPLYREGKCATSIVDYVSYKVTASEKTAQGKTFNLLNLKFPEIEISPFLPEQKAEGNAADYYYTALQIWKQLKQNETKDENISQLVDNPIVKKAMAAIYDGSHIKNCDFTKFYSITYNLLKGDLPDFNVFEMLVRCMAYYSKREAQKGNFKVAKDICSAIIGFGTHLRDSAFTTMQFYWGIKIQKLGFSTLAEIEKDWNLISKINSNLRLLDETKEIFQMKQLNLRKDIVYWKLTPDLPKSIIDFLPFLDDSEPIYRIQALQTICTWYNPENYFELQLEKDKNFPDFINSLSEHIEEVEAKIKYISENDPDERVRKVATLVLRNIRK